MEDFIRIVDLKFGYNSGYENDILNGINLNIKKGEFLAILGHNGSGKSTFAKQLNAMLLPTSGDVFVNGMNTKDENKLYDVRSCVGLVLQNPDNQLISSIVEEDVAFGPENLGLPPKEIRKRVDEALKSVDMYDYRKNSIYGLSGGQKQKVAIAGIIAMQPECIVLDEPTAMLDPIGRQEVIKTVKKLNKEKNITVVLITHYMDEAVNADRIVVMKDGKIASIGTPESIFSNPCFLENCQLSVPQAVEFLQKLKENGQILPELALDEKDCIRELKKYLSMNLSKN